MENFKERKKDNPFYDNHLFSKEDLKRATFKWYEHPALWFVPMNVQITEDGVAYYKVWKGRYYFYKMEPFNQLR